MKIFLSLMLCAFMLVPIFTVSAAEPAVTVSAEYLDDVLEPLPEYEPVSAQPGTVLELEAKSVILIEPYTGRILYENNADEKLAPASITKIMSLLLVMEALDAGKYSTDTVHTASEHACSMGGSQIWLEPGEQMTVDELLRAAVIASANDAMVALAELTSGSEEGFVALMNQRAMELGMDSTHFVNCTGLDAEGHLTTAHDVALVSAELIKHDRIKQYSTVWMDYLRDGKSELVNTNKLVRFYEGCTGLKTGTTSTAGYCLSATAERQGMNLVAVVMRGDSSAARFEAARKLLDYGFANYTFAEIQAENAENLILKARGGTKSVIKVVPGGAFCHLMSKGEVGGITQTVSLPEVIDAPVKEGDVVGHITISDKNGEIGLIELKAAENVEKMTVMFTFINLLMQLFSL